MAPVRWVVDFVQTVRMVLAHVPKGGRMAKVEPRPFGPERAAEIWAERGPQHELAGLLTPGEEAYVAQVWAGMPGHTCWMDAFHRVRLGRL